MSHSSELLNLRMLWKPLNVASWSKVQVAWGYPGLVLAFAVRKDLRRIEPLTPGVYHKSGWSGTELNYSTPAVVKTE